MATGSLKIGAGTTPGAYVLPQVLGRMKVAHPHIEVGLEIAASEVIQTRLLAHELEVAVVGGLVASADLEQEPFLVDELLLIVYPDHPWARRKAVPARRLAGAPLIWREHGSATRALAERALQSAGIAPAVTMELGSTDAIKRAVANGLGISLVSRFAVEPEAGLGSLVPLKVTGVNLTRRFLAVWHRDSNLSPAAQAFLELLREARHSGT